LAGIPDRVINRAKKILYSIENEEQDLTNSFSDQVSAETGPVQMDLFSKKEHFFVDKLSKLDISKMTPIEALNFLNELLEKAKDITK
jgi:DNA mismatch repair protein MutS